MLHFLKTIVTPERQRMVLNILPFAYGIGLLSAYSRLIHKSDSYGSVLINDFYCFWIAAKAAIERGSEIVYDNQAFFEFGGSFFREEGFLHFMYPPAFLLAIYPLGYLWNPAAFLIFAAVTLAAYLWVGKLAWGNWQGALLLAAMPTTLFVIYHGQNGFLLAALFGGAMVALNARRYVLAGILIGCLTIKPQIGLLIPFALLAGRYWTTFAAAALTAAGLVLVSWLAFGTPTWTAFLEQTFFARSVVTDEILPVHLHITPFTMMQQLGISYHPAMAVQAAVTAGLLALIVWMWRQVAPVYIKAAALISAAMLATPYLLSYDMVIISFPVLFYLKARWQSGLSAREVWILAGVVATSALAKIISVNFGMPIGPVAPVLMLGLSVQSIFEMRNSKPELNTGDAAAA